MAGTVDTNRLYFGDCLEVMREDIPDESVDLIYLDPPFNSKRLYNAYIGGAQWVAFNDTWQWHEAVEDFHEVARDVVLADTMEGLRRICGEGSNLAYLSYMANRLRECRRVLKPEGSIYLHCDQTMGHYLKVVMDAIFGHRNFRNTIHWYYYNKMHDSRKKLFAVATDTLLFYARDIRSGFQFQQLTEARDKPVRQLVRKKVDGRMVNARDAAGKIMYQTKTDRTINNVWRIPCLQPASKEWIEYPTQKPIALLDRVLRASSNAGDVVLDPFCGCGTTIHAAQLLGRQWIGIDVCVNACKVIERRLREHFSDLWADVAYIGMPKTVEDAHELANIDKFRFERWAASLVDGMEANKNQRGDHGIDGRGRLPIRKGVFLDVVSQVKGGSTGPGDVQAFNGARQQAGADLGIFTCFEDRVTANMRNAAVSAGRFMDVPRVQIYTVEDYFSDRRPVMPAAAA